MIHLPVLAGRKVSMTDMATADSPTYRAVIVGLGFIGGGDQVSGDAIGGQQVGNLDGTHAGALAKNPRIQLVAGSSRDARRRERFAKRTGVRTHADWREMLDKEKPDIVSVATYAPFHAEITIACAKKGVRVIYCEKPVATRLVEAEQMIAACKRSGALFVINHNRRFSPSHRRLREVVAAGNLGRLTSASLQWGGGRLGNVGTHMIDALRMLTGREVRGVSGTLDLSGKPDCRGPQFRDPGGWGILRMDDGLMATVDAADYAKVSGRIILNGANGRAIVRGQEVTLEFNDGRQEHWPSAHKEETSMDRAVAEIVAWLDDQTAFSYPAIEAIRTLEAIIAFHASHARNSAWTELPLKGPDRDIELQSG